MSFSKLKINNMLQNVQVCGIKSKYGNSELKILFLYRHPTDRSNANDYMNISSQV